MPAVVGVARPPGAPGDAGAGKLTLERVLVAEEAAEAARVQSHHEQGIRKLLSISRMRLAKGLRFLGQG